jgi:hypothetical protein
MNEQNWKKILERDDKEDWLWYARWLRDEQENESKARAVEWLINEDKYPDLYKYLDYIAYCWYQKTYETSYKHNSIVEKDIFVELNKQYTASYLKFTVDHKTILDAKLDLINAYELYKSTNPDLDAAPGE